MTRKIKVYEIDALLDYIKDYTISIMRNENNDSVEDAVSEINQREVFKEYLMDFFQVDKDE